ncbi:hypothetical protein D9758_001794 [Tetrapyrgos nigripes]|uniref:P-loop containing nucleoside triphosphate hydrolase protein n=1 Tax=Tetrapyrgos nigripes TaxID=182062 RepID=A0A8H5LUU6_9AGAR|nr:hypothetical protein D9758_001794 [Tetrapyrgos nigripes]
MDDLRPRSYQNEVFTQAQHENIIAALGTGSGKTYISSLLVKWITTCESSKGKVIVFLVPKVALCEQQGRFLERTTSLRVATLHGASANVELDDRAGWKRRFETTDVFVFTAQLFLNLLTHSIWSIDKVSLVIFDECHHARKSHPYNAIMREYNLVDPKDRPKIFGMTASPISDPKKMAASLATLEENLNSRVVGVKENLDELALHSPKPQEVIQEYPPSPEEYDFPSPTLWSCLHIFNFDTTPMLDIAWPDIERRYYVTLSNLGPYCASLYLIMEMKHAIKQAEETQRSSAFASTIDLEVLDSDMSLNVSPADQRPTAFSSEFHLLVDIVNDFEPFFQYPPASSLSAQSPLPLEIPLEWCSPKIRSLVDILLAHLADSHPHPHPNSNSDSDSGPDPDPGSNSESESTFTFQCIIFVEQRQVAGCLARVLPYIAIGAGARIRGGIKCGFLVGQGTSGASEDRTSKMLAMALVDSQGQNQSGASRSPLELFRRRELNVLIATSVAEEGLDFPACDLVIRFDPLQHLVGYIQSRGRARETKKVSKYVIMMQKNDVVNMERYRAFCEIEPRLKEVYLQNRGQQGQGGQGLSGQEQEMIEDIKGDEEQEKEEGEEDEVDSRDLETRERYVVPSTNAFANYDNSIQLLEHLCALLPKDVYTALPKPVFTVGVAGPVAVSGESDLGRDPRSQSTVQSQLNLQLQLTFQSTLRLPAALPLPPGDLVYTGPLKSTKKEAKRAVAFIAVKRLHQLDVFDDYLFPVSRAGIGDGDGDGDGGVDTEGRGVRNVGGVPVMMDVWTRDPWVIPIRDGDRLWIHPVYADGVLLAGIVTGTVLSPVQLRVGGVSVETKSGRLLDSHLDGEGEEEGEGERHIQRKLMSEYTKLGIWYRITSVPLGGPPSLFLVPITPITFLPDFSAIERLLLNPLGNTDWSSITEAHYNRVLVRNNNQHGRTWLLRRIRRDISPMTIMPESESSEGQTYHEYFTKKWTRKKWDPAVPMEGLMIEVSRLARSQSSAYPLYTENLPREQDTQIDPEIKIIPLGCCGWVDMSKSMIQAFGLLPPLIHCITDIYRIRQAKFELGLPPIRDDLMIQALTIPNVAASYSNQRLETLGDAVLEICTTVHLFNKYPHRHEGQLTVLRKNSICNQFLLARALDVGLDRFIISEKQSWRSWPYVVSEDETDSKSSHSSPPLSSRRLALRQYPRRSLQDCMEATLGAAFLTGGIHTALQAGVALGMTFGGSIPWCIRYPREESFVSPLFAQLQDDLGYTFRNGSLLKEAVTHPSFASSAETSSYQRLEFLGDAVLDLVVVHYLYNKFPTATSAQLALPRTKAVCSAALAYIAVKHLAVQKIMLVNNVDLSMAVEQYVPHFEQASAKSIVERGWRYDPPKALSDVFEGIVGAILIDSGYDYERTACVVEGVMQDLLDVLSPSVPLDPVSTLTRWLQASGCQQRLTFRQEVRNGRTGEQVYLHDILISGPIFSTSPSIARNIAAERAYTILQDTAHEKHFQRVCSCMRGCEKLEATESLAEQFENITVDEDQKAIPEL